MEGRASVTQEWENAVRHGDLVALARLIEAGADIDAKNQQGQTGLMLSARDGRVDVARLLVDRGADLNHTAKFHLSALMLAVINGRMEIVRTLVHAGADRSLRGSGAPGFHDKTALDLARDLQGQELVSVLQNDPDTGLAEQ